MVVPRVIHPDHRRTYAPYYAGTVFYAPYDIDLDVYYFPVNDGGRLTYRPYYYFNGDLFFTLSVGGPRFFFQIAF